MSLAAFALCSATSARSYASPEDIFGFGPRSTAMGGTGAAHASGFEAVYANPALLGGLRERRLVVGYQAASFDLSRGASYRSGSLAAYDAARGVSVGVDVPLPLRGALKDRVGVAVAFYTPETLLVRARLLFPETEQYPLLPDRTQSIMIRMGVGVDLGYGIQVGGGFAALAELAGKVVIATDATGRVGSRVESQLVATYAPAFGVAYDVTKRLRVGANYRGQLDARFDVAVDATKLSPSLALPVFTIGGLAQYDPEQVGVELAYGGDDDTFALGATYKRWSRFPGLIEPTVHCPETEPRCGALVPPTVPYSDTVALHVGGEHRLRLSPSSTVKARGGLRFDPSPLPSEVPASKAYDQTTGDTSDLPTRYLDSSRIAPSIGMGIRFVVHTVPIDLDWFGAVHFLIPRTVRSVDGRGQPLWEGRSAGRVLTTGLFLGVSF